MTTAVAEKTASVPAKAKLQTGGGVAAIVPQDVEQAWRMATMIAASPMAPKDMKQPEHIVIAILHGLEVGLKPMQAVQSIAVVNGRPVIWGDAALGLVRGSDLLEDFEERIEGDGDAMVAICRARRKGQQSQVIHRFSVADAKKAGLWGKTGPWTQYPKRMLQMRARSWCLRDGFADVLKGLNLREEVRDFVASAERAEPRAVNAEALRQQAAAAEPPVTDAEFTESTPSEAPAATTAAEDDQAEQAPAGGEDDDPAGWPAWLARRQNELDAASTIDEVNEIKAAAEEALFSEDDRAPQKIVDDFKDAYLTAAKRVTQGKRR